MFFEDNSGKLYYKSKSNRYWEVSNMGGITIDELPPDVEVLLMTNGGIYPIIARRIEKQENEI